MRDLCGDCRPRVRGCMCIWRRDMCDGCGKYKDTLRNCTCVDLDLLEKGHPMKIFFLWLFAQALFARVLFGMAISLYTTMKLPPEFLFTLLLPTTIICLAEAITSAIVAYPLILSSVGIRMGGR